MIAGTIGGNHFRFQRDAAIDREIAIEHALDRGSCLIHRGLGQESQRAKIDAQNRGFALADEARNTEQIPSPPSTTIRSARWASADFSSATASSREAASGSASISTPRERSHCASTAASANASRMAALDYQANRAYRPLCHRASRIIMPMIRRQRAFPLVAGLSGRDVILNAGC